MARLAVVGAGVMGEAIIRGLLGAGWSAADIVITDIRSDRCVELSGELGVKVAPDGAAAAAEAEAVLLAVKPQDAEAALDGLAGQAGARGILSIVAGLRTAAIEDRLGGTASVVRAMPNTPARIGKGATALAPGRHVAEGTRKLADEAFSSVGTVVWVSETQMDAVTAVSGSGPAYLFLFAEALVDAGVATGLPRPVAESLAYATIEGSAAMLTSTGEHPAALRAQVTSPGGTTAAGIAVLEAMAVRAAVGEAVRAAERRSRELGS